MSERLEYKSLLWLERRTYRTADRVVVSINESYKKKALTRGNHKPENVTVVGSEPDTGRMRSVYPDPRIRRDAFFLLVYFGIMTPQGGEDLILEVMNALVYRRGRSDVHTAVLGFGDCPDRLAILQQQCHELELAKWVTFMGRADKAMPADYLSAADVGLCPDRKTR